MTWREVADVGMDFLRSLADALLLLVGAVLSLAITAIYVAYVIVVYLWRPLLLVAGVLVLAWWLS